MAAELEARIREETAKLAAQSERRLTEEVTKIEGRLTFLQDWMFIFWAGQIGALLGILLASS